MLIDWKDNFLLPLILPNELEYIQEAKKFVERLTSNDEIIKELIELRVYMLVCRDNLEAGEIFKTKYDLFKSEFEIISNKKNTGVYNVKIERG
jgi:ABC-type ATPase with predicted acetyltransferase domain